MKNKARTNTRNKVTRYVWAAIWVLISAQLLAQEEAKDTAPSEQDTPAASELPVPTSPADPASEPPATANSPFDYQASEKISEDLSVSFPVDI